MPAQEQAIQNESRHAVFVNRFAGGLNKDFLPFLDDLKTQITFKLASEQTPHNQGRLNALIREVTLIQRGIYSEYEGDLINQLDLFAELEGDFEVKNLDDVIESDVIEVKTPAPAQLIAAAKSNPLIFPDSNDTILLQPFIKNWSDTEIKRVNSIIRTGFAMGETSQQIASRIAGKNGTLNKQTKRNNAAIVRTATNHVSMQAKQAVYDENDDIVIGYEWVSTLDGRTSNQCKSLDGQVFLNRKKGFKPKPPIHVSCRSTTAPVLDSRFDLDDSAAKRASSGSSGGKAISADTTYYSFLKRQTHAFQDETLGRTRAKLFRDGGLNADEFAKLTVDQKFRPLTLDEMRQKAPMAFEKADL
jgi:SPP1 gp7 family putative phage head morphogenesis protein